MDDSPLPPPDADVLVDQALDWRVPIDEFYTALEMLAASRAARGSVAEAKPQPARQPDERF